MDVVKMAVNEWKNNYLGNWSHHWYDFRFDLVPMLVSRQSVI